MAHTRPGRDARERRQQSAVERQERWDKLSRTEKILSLVERGHGHCKQADRLNKLANREQ